MTEENENPVTETVDDAATEIPEETVTETETHEDRGSDNNEILAAIEAIPSKIVDVLNTAKEESPVTPTEEEILDETPLRKPWTHRNPFRRG